LVSVYFPEGFILDDFLSYATLKLSDAAVKKTGVIIFLQCCQRRRTFQPDEIRRQMVLIRILQKAEGSEETLQPDSGRNFQMLLGTSEWN
jgi:hypothetical protein